MSTEFKLLDEECNQQAAAWFTLIESNNATDEQWLQFEAWLSESEDNQAAFMQVQSLYLGLGEMRDDLAPFINEVHQTDAKDRVIEPSASLWDILSDWLVGHRGLVAGCFAVLLAFFFVLAEQPSTPPMSQSELVYATDKGQVRTLVLDDGSSVDLGADSEIRVKFSPAERRVELRRGEAYFDVSSNAERPFYVRASNVMVRVVGTQFDIRKRYRGVSVSVAEGRVSVTDITPLTVQNGDESIFLEAGQSIVKHGMQPLTESAIVLDQAAGSWRGGHLVYTNAKLIDVILDANRYYQGSMTLVSSELFDERVTLSLRHDQVGLLPVMLSETLPIDVVQQNDGIELIKKDER